MSSLEREIFDVEGTERYSGAARPRQSWPTSSFTITDGKIENGQFTATLTGDDSADEATVPSFDSVRGIIGTIISRFFGPNAEELGGAVSASRMNDDPSDPVLYGYIGANRTDAGTKHSGLTVCKRAQSVTSLTVLP